MVFIHERNATPGYMEQVVMIRDNTSEFEYTLRFKSLTLTYAIIDVKQGEDALRCSVHYTPSGSLEFVAISCRFPLSQNNISAMLLRAQTSLAGTKQELPKTYQLLDEILDFCLDGLSEKTISNYDPTQHTYPTALEDRGRPEKS